MKYSESWGVKLFKTRYILDELGNLQSDKKGIPGLDTLLSIGLGQDQQFTLVLQTMQQLISVYGSDVDKVIQGNVANIIFLKSTDDSLLETLQKMSGTKHVSEIDGKNIGYDIEKIWLRTEGKVNYNFSTKEVPVIKYNDLAFIKMRNSIIFRAGAAPIWNRNQTAHPMSWRLHMNTIEVPGKKFTLKTIPTTSTVMEYDLRKNQPNFEDMLEKRISQALLVEQCVDMYKNVHGFSDFNIAQLDPDEFASDVLDLITSIRDNDMEDDEMLSALSEYDLDNVEPNEEFIQTTMNINQKLDANKRKVYAGGKWSREMFYPDYGVVDGHGGQPNHSCDSVLIKAYLALQGEFKNASREGFDVQDDSLYIGDTLAIRKLDMSEYAETVQQASHNPSSKVYSESGEPVVETSYEVTDDFYKYLADMTSWKFLGGKFDKEVARQIIKEEKEREREN